MTFLPIVDRELRVAGRRHSTYWIRQGVALAAVAVGCFIYLASLNSPGAPLGQLVFAGLSGLALIYCLAAGRAFTADCLSQEKREGTLGLLFLTDLKGHDVVLGKLAATSLSAFYGLLAIVPVLTIPLLIGGITRGEVWRMVLVLVNTFLFSLAIGVFVSALSRDARRAMGANFLLAIMLMAAPAACAAAIAYLSSSRLILHPLFFSCPAYSCYLCFDANHRGQEGHFWASLAVTHALTWLLVGLASRIAPRAWKDPDAGVGKLSFRDRWQSLVYGNPAKRRALRARLLEVNPFCWLTARSVFKPVGVWIVLGFLAAWWLFMRFALQISASDAPFSLATDFLLNITLKLWIAIEAGYQLAEEQRSGALEFLLSTPLSGWDIQRGQLLALRRQFLGPLLAVIAVELLVIVLVSNTSFQEGPSIPVIETAGLVMLLCDIAALPWVAMAAALTSKSPNHASVTTISRVLILPWILYGAIQVLVAVWAAASARPPPDWKLMLCIWSGLGLFTDVAFGLPAWWSLRTRFRSLALRRLNAARASLPGTA